MTSLFSLTVAKAVFFVLLAGLIAAVLARLLLRIIIVQGSSMHPTLQAGERVLVLRYWPVSRLKRDYIVISEISDALAMPPRLREHLAETPHIKRIAGLPGDTLNIHVSELPEKWRERERPKYDRQGYRTWSVPADHYFLRGDGVSSDSLIWGPIPIRAFRGLVIARLPHKAKPAISTLKTES